MIKLPIYFPPYEDELLYGWFFRLIAANHVKTKNFRKYFGMDMKETAHISKNLNISGLFWLSKKWSNFPDLLDVLFKHTSLMIRPKSTSELDFGRKIQGFLYNRGDSFYDVPHHLLSYPKMCLECVKEDLEKGINPYIRTWHSGKHVEVCVKHKKVLQKVKFSEENYELGEKLDCEEDSYSESEKFYNEWARSIQTYKHPVVVNDVQIDDCTIIKEYGQVVSVICNKCGLEFLTTKVMLDLGRNCPVCELEEDIPAKILNKKGYSLTRRISNIEETHCVRHDSCGCISQNSVKKIMYYKNICDCEKQTILDWDKSKLREHYKIPDEYKIISCRRNDHGDNIIEVKHELCGRVFERKAAEFKTGIRCECYKEHSDEKIRELYGIGDDYDLINWYRIKGCIYLHLKHIPCGREFTTAAGTFATSLGCNCPQSLTKEKLKAKYKIPDSYEILNCYKDEKTKETIIEGIHKPCGSKFKKYARDLKKEQCGACEGTRRKGQTKERFIERVSELVGDEYIVCGEYLGSNKKIAFYHSKCGNITEISNRRFVEGARCRCEKRITPKDVEKYLEEFEPNFTVKFVKPYYEVTFKDTLKKVKLTAKMIRQEATCLCKPTYFTRKKKS